MQPAPEWAIDHTLGSGLAGCSATSRRGVWVVGDYARVRVASAIDPSGVVTVPTGALVTFDIRFGSTVSGVWSTHNQDVATVVDK